MRLIHLPGVHRPVSDTWLLADAMEQQGIKGAHVADICTGTGALAIKAARSGAATVAAVDLTLRAALCARVNARLNGTHIRVYRGNLFRPLAGLRFDVIVSNPPYIPAETDHLPRHGKTVPLDAGRDGRALIDQICKEASAHLRPGGALLLVHSSVCGTEQTIQAMFRAGLHPDLLASSSGPLGPVLAARANMLRERGLLGVEEREEVVVIRGTRLQHVAPISRPNRSEKSGQRFGPSTLG